MEAGKKALEEAETPEERREALEMMLGFDSKEEEDSEEADEGEQDPPDTPRE